MKRFLTTTAATLVLSSAAYAEGHTAMFSDMSFDTAINVNASDMMGMRVYASEADINNETVIAQDGEKEWDDIGEINEIVLTREGTVQSVVIGVGGFVGIGEKDVAISMDQLKFVSDGDDADQYFIVVNASAAGVKEAPAYERTAMTDGMDNDRSFLTAPVIERDGYSSAMVEDLTTENLTGARVYGPGDEDVGEISELLLNADGQIDRAVIDVGGFLGMGERPVAVTLKELNIVRSEDGDDLRVYIDSAQDALEQLPEYEG